MNKINLIIIIFCIIFMVLPSFVQCSDVDVDKYKEIYKDTSDVSKIKTMGAKVLGIAQVIGISAGSIIILVLAMKYMLSSTNEKATIKEQAIPFLIGAILLFGGSAILTIIAQFARTMAD